MTHEIPGPVFCSVSDQIALHGRFRAQDVALIEDSARLTWGEYNAAANRVAHALRARGIVPGARVALLVTNSLWAHELLLGIWRAGAVAVPLSPLLTTQNLRTMLADSGAVCLFASDEYMAAARVAADALPVFDQADLRQLTAKASAAFPGVAQAPDDLAVIIYSSGTTGTPKGIVHNHASRVAFAAYLAAEFRFHYRSVSLSCIPIHSNGAWLSWLPAKWVGATTVILKAFSADAYLRAVREHAPTHGFAVPTMAAALLQHPDIESTGLACFETLITAGSPMPAAIKCEMQRLTGHALYELWGLTEGVATIMSPRDMVDRPTSVGRPILGCDIRLIDADDRDVTFSGAGEIVGYSGGLMSGYHNRDDANRSVLWRDADGRRYLRTGDIGEFDRDGYLTLRGRKKDMILSGGFNVYPVDIETVLLSHPAVAEAVVIGVDHAKWGEAPVAIVRLRSSASNDHIDELLAFTNARLAKHQRLHAISITAAEFPRNTLGKVLKNIVKDDYLARNSSPSP